MLQPILELDQRALISELGEDLRPFLKHRIEAVQQKMRRYEGRIEQYKQSRMFVANQRKLYQIIDGVQRNNVQSPEVGESLEFWSGIWSNPTKHNVNAEWLTKLDKDLKGIEKQDDVLIDSAKVLAQLRKVPYWKSPGPDGLQSCWLKNLPSCVDRIAKHLQDCLHVYNVLEWMSRGKTSLVMKDKKKYPQ